MNFVGDAITLKRLDRFDSFFSFQMLTIVWNEGFYGEKHKQSCPGAINSTSKGWLIQG